MSTAPAVWWALAGLTALAVLVRCWRLTVLPPGYWYDEAHKSLVALEILRGLQTPIYVTDGSGLEAGYFWLLAGWFRLFGPSYFGSRALSALLGALTVPLTFWPTYMLYRAHGQTRAAAVGLVSAGLLTVLFWHVHWSRLGLETITVPLFAVALLGLLAWAWQRKARWAFALAGAALGLSQYTNPGARVLPVQALLVFALLANGRWQNVLGFGVALIAGAALVYEPLGLFFLRNPALFFGRVAFVSSHARAGGWSFYLDSALKTLLSLNFRGDALVRHNLAGRPALDGITSLWMFAGLGVMLRWRNAWRSHLALLAALGVNLLPMVFSDGAPGFGRTLGAAPILTAVPALGVVAALEWGRGRPWPLILVAGSLVISAGWNLYDYFVRYPRQPGLFDAFEVGLWTLNQAAVRASQTGAAYLILDEPSLQHPATRLTRELTPGDLRLVNGGTCFAYPANTTTETLLATLPQWIPQIRVSYPQAVVTDILHEPEVYQYGALLRVPGGQHAAAGAARVAALAEFGGLFDLLTIETPEEAYSPGTLVPITLYWRALASTAVRFTTFVHLTKPGVPFLAGVDGEPCQGWYPTNNWHPDEIIEYRLDLTLPSDIAPGKYDLAVGMYDGSTGVRLHVSHGDGREPDRAFVKTLTVK